MAIFFYANISLVQAEDYKWVFSGTGGYTASSPGEVCEHFFDWYEEYYSSPQDVLSNFRVVDVGKGWENTGPGKVFTCYYDLQRPHGFFPDKHGQTYRIGDECPFGTEFNFELGACLEPTSSCPSVGNPIEVTTGVKVQAFVDLQVHGFPIERYYRGDYAGGWSFSFDEKARFNMINGQEYILRIYKGRKYFLKKVDATCWQDQGGECYEVAMGGTAVSITQGDVTKAFDLRGRLISVKNKTYGKAFSFDYSQAEQTLIRFGLNQIEVSYHSGKASQIKLGSDIIQYRYQGNGLLYEVEKSDGVVEYYKYQETSGRSQLVEHGFDQKPFAHWAYDPQYPGRAIKSWHTGDFEAFTLEYLQNEVAVTNPYGKVTRYLFETHGGLRKVKEIIGEPSPNCAAANKSYDYYPNGTLKSNTDWEGNTTTYLRDDYGRETARTEAFGTPQARTITTAYHPTLNKPETITEPGLITRMTYDSAGRLLSTTKTATAQQ